MRKLILFFTLIAVLTPIAHGETAQEGQFGLGVIAGEPTGPCFKLWTSQHTAIDGAAAWSFAKNAGIHLHADYLVHVSDLAEVESGRLLLYYGIGGRIRFADGDRDDNIGIRIPVGLAYLVEDVSLDVFFEIVPILDLVPDTDLDFNAALGVRYFF
jgi:hypothetical protein